MKRNDSTVYKLSFWLLVLAGASFCIGVVGMTGAMLFLAETVFAGFFALVLFAFPTALASLPMSVIDSWLYG